MHQVLFEQFVASFESAPEELILDFDCTDDRVHGLQEGRHFHGFYYDFCFLPLYVFCGERLLVSLGGVGRRRSTAFFQSGTKNEHRRERKQSAAPGTGSGGSSAEAAAWVFSASSYLNRSLKLVQLSMWMHGSI